MEVSLLSHTISSLLIFFFFTITTLVSSSRSRTEILEVLQAVNGTLNSTNYSSPKLDHPNIPAAGSTNATPSSPLDPSQLISSSSSSSPSNYSNVHYLKTSCKNTTYPKLCYKSLSSYANQIQSNPKILANVALNLTLIATKSAIQLMQNISKLHDLNPKEAAAMADCVEVVEQAIDELEMSIGEMGKARGSNSDPAINDIQTWVSAALTDDDTCIDGLSGKAINDQVKKIIRKITRVSHLTSIALAFINNFASSTQ